MDPEAPLNETVADDADSDAAAENICLSQNHSSLDSFQACISEQALAQIRYMSSTQADIFTFIYVCISVLGVVGNGLVIFVVVRRPEMRTTRNVFIVNLALSNFLLASILVPFLWLPAYRIEFPYGAFMCKVAQAFPGTNIFCSTLTVSVIAVDRYYAVVRTQIGPNMTNTFPAILISIAIWALSFALSILYLLHFNIKDYLLPAEYIPAHVPRNPSNVDVQHILLFQRCELQPQPCVDMEDDGDQEGAAMCLKYYETAVSGIMSVFIYFVPVPVLVIFSCLLTRFLANNERRTSVLRNRVTASPAIASSIAAPSTPTQDTGGALATAAAAIVRAHMHIAQSPTPQVRASASARSPASAACRRRSRTTALLFAMAFSNALLWLPFTVISLYIQLGPSDVTNRLHYELQQLDDAAKLISMLSICVNPFLYGYLNTNFQREFKLIFQKCIPCLASRSSEKNAILLLPTATTYVPHGRDNETSVTIYVNGNHAVRGWAIQ